MRIKAWAPPLAKLSWGDRRGEQFTTYDQIAPPWIERQEKNGNEPYVKLSITNEEYGDPPSGETRVMITESEWPIMKARIDAAFAGKDANRSDFYRNPDGSWKLDPPSAPVERIDDVDPSLLWLLRRAGDEWGPLGVAKVAARLAQHHVEPGLEQQ